MRTVRLYFPDREGALDFDMLLLIYHKKCTGQKEPVKHVIV